MGARAADTLNEITEIRRGLDEKLTELERRMPPLLRTGKRAAIAIVGGSAGSGVLAIVAKRALGRNKRKHPAEQQPAAVPAIQVLPKGTVPVALAIAAVWAGVRIYEARTRSQRADAAPRLAQVRQIPEARGG